MTTVIEYFVRHYTLVLDNDQGLYNAVRTVIREVTKSADVTVSQYRAMSREDRATEFAGDIGEKVLDLVGERYLAAIEGREDTAGGMLIREIMIESDSGISWELGKHYLPESDDAGDFFDEDA
jgi:hypothetical protein